MSDQQIEQEIQAKGLTAPRVTPQRIEEVIAAETYFTAADGATASGDPFHDSLSLLTFCVLTLQNGFTVTGESACASPENFSAELGRKIARDNAVNKVWMLEGYLLKQQLREQGCSIQSSHIDRMRQERVELCDRLNKLGNFIATEKFTSLAANEQSRMKRQLVAMREYAEVLGERLQYELKGMLRPDNPSVAS